MAGLTKKGQTYYALFSINGKTKWKKIGKVSFKDAKEHLRKLESQYDKNRIGLLYIEQITFNEYSVEYLKFSKANKAQGTWERDITSTRALSAYFGDMLLSSINNRHIDIYKYERQKKGLTNRTINIELICLSVMLKKAIEWNYLSELPHIKKLKEQKKPPRYLTKNEINLFIESAPLWLKFILIVLRNSGLRSKQLRELKIDHANFDRDVLMIHNTKGNNYYTVSMNEELKTTLLYMKDSYVSPLGQISPRQNHQSIYFFCNTNGEPIKSFRHSFNKGVKRAGLKNVTPHVLRHTFASHLVMSGVDLPTVKELLGHKSIITTMIYSHLSDEHKAKAVRKLSWAKPELKLADKLKD